MYRVYPVTGGYQIFWCPSWPKHDSDKVAYSARVYPFRQAAYRMAKKLNERMVVSA